MLTFYETEIKETNGEFDDVLQRGMISAAEILRALSGYQIFVSQTIKPQQHPDVSRFVQFLFATAFFQVFYLVYIIFLRTPEKTIIWKATVSVMAALTAVQIYFEGETFINYLNGEGLIFSPAPFVIGFMAYLLVVLSLALLLRVNFIVKFKRKVC